VLVGWTHPYAPFGAPLIDRELGETAISAWLDHMANDRKLPDLMLLPYVSTEGPFARALDAVLARRSDQSRCFAEHRRALLAPAQDREDRKGYLDHAVGQKKRKELRRQRKRLGDSGAVTSITTEAATIAPALADFLALEAQGWKGRAGTAARDQADIAAFMITAVTALAGEGKAQVTRLCVDARAIAAMVTLRSGTTAWCWKIAYDESRARFSPGVQILLDVTQTLLDDQSLTRADSCATADHPMIDHIGASARADGSPAVRKSGEVIRLCARLHAGNRAPRRHRRRKAAAGCHPTTIARAPPAAFVAGTVPGFRTTPRPRRGPGRRPDAHAGEIGQPEMQELRRFARGEGHALAGLQINSRQRADRLIDDRARATGHDIDALAVRGEARAGSRRKKLDSLRRSVNTPSSFSLTPG